MSTIRRSNGEEYALEFVEGLPANYMCTNCHQFLGEPYQNAECGDRFCGDCMRLITNGAKKCPECSTMMTKDTTFADAAVRRDIDGFEVCCPFKRFDCEETLLYRNLKDHIETCSKKPTVSPVASAATESPDALEIGLNTMSLEAGDAGDAQQIRAMSRELQTPEETAQGACPVRGSISFEGNGASSSASVTTSSSATRSGITRRNPTLTENTDPRSQDGADASGSGRPTRDTWHIFERRVEISATGMVVTTIQFDEKWRRSCYKFAYLGSMLFVLYTFIDAMRELWNKDPIYGWITAAMVILMVCVIVHIMKYLSK